MMCNGIGPISSMGWVGLGQEYFNVGGLGWIGLRNNNCLRL